MADGKIITCGDDESGQVRVMIELNTEISEL